MHEALDGEICPCTSTGTGIDGKAGVIQGDQGRWPARSQSEQKQGVVALHVAISKSQQYREPEHGEQGVTSRIAIIASRHPQIPGRGARCHSLYLALGRGQFQIASGSLTEASLTEVASNRCGRALPPAEFLRQSCLRGMKLWMRSLLPLQNL